MGGVKGVVPVGVEFVSGDREGLHLAVADLDSGWVGAGVKGGGHGQAGVGRSRADQVEGIGEFFAALAGEARLHPEHGQRLVTWWPETVAAATTGALVRPDAYGEWAEGHRTVGFFLELDRGTEKLETLLRKLGQYTELAHAGVTGRAVLFHLPTPGRENHPAPRRDTPLRPHRATRAEIGRAHV